MIDAYSVQSASGYVAASFVDIPSNPRCMWTFCPHVNFPLHLVQRFEILSKLSPHTRNLVYLLCNMPNRQYDIRTSL